MNRSLKNKELEIYLKGLLGTDLETFLNAPPEPTAIRVNNLKADNQWMKTYLDSHQYQYRSIPFSRYGWILEDDRIPLSHTLEYFEGYFHYQGIASQLPVELLDVQPNEIVLDMTAAPGSKSTQLAAKMQQKGILVLNDSSYSRIQALQSRMQRSGAFNFYILKSRAENLTHIYQDYFDKILLDAPCSALGTLSSNFQVRSWWSNDKLQKLANLQYQLLLAAFKMLKIGGELVYATCSIAPEENEYTIDRILKKLPLQIVPLPAEVHKLFDSGWTGFTDVEFDPKLKYALRIWPHIHQYEGFFVVRLKKTAEIPFGQSLTLTEWRDTFSADANHIKPVLENLSERWGIPYHFWQNYRYILTKSRIWMVSAEILQVPDTHFVAAGLLLGEKRLSGWKLINTSAQFLSGSISRRRITLADQDLHTLFSEGTVKCNRLIEDYYILEYNGRSIASVYHENGMIRIHLPHHFKKVPDA